MSLTISANRIAACDFQNGSSNLPHEEAVPVESKKVSAAGKGNLPRVSSSVEFTALGCDTEHKLAQAA